uniref:EGF-like domain-containing protein n=1 Tax=Mola mola TaxID=94237 RepID=A0A3Q3WBH3_MOLML
MGLVMSACCVFLVAPPPFQLAPDTPSPVEPIPTQATPRPDPCEGRPCLNGGLCVATGGPEDTWVYACTCSQGFTGRNCEFFIDPCASSPCLHGNCSRINGGEEVEQFGPKVNRFSTSSIPLSRCLSTRVVVNASSAPVLWRVSEEGFLRSSILNGTTMWFLQASDGLVVPDNLLPLGQNYFLSVLRVGAPTAPEVILRLSLMVKASSCVEPGSSFNDPQCSGKGNCVTQPSESTFFCECEGGYAGISCEEFDACHYRPCHNNGTCFDVRQGGDGRKFTCTCLPGYEGERCQLLVDHCDSQPCKNGATCFSGQAGPRCYCPEGYQGATCEQKVDPCASSPCHNNGTCYAQGPGSLGFGCSCTAGFTGPTCAQLVDFCALNPCAHGVCRSVGNSYRCLCVPGYHGLYCEDEYNECLSAPCQNYATCRDLINAYECVCTPQFEGRHCEIYKDPCLSMHCQNGGRCESAGLNASCACPPGYLGERCEVDINECESNPCHRGGTCIDQSNGFSCHCPPGWVGPSCEIHLQWKPAHTEDALTNMPRHSLYIIIGALCVAFVLMLIILIVGICRISRIEYQGSSRHAYQEFYNCRSIDSEFSNAIASIRHARFGKKSRPAMYDATPIAYEDYSPDDKPLVTLIKTKDL